MLKILASQLSSISKHKNIFPIIAILIIINLPYLINIPQDLLTEPVANPLVCHDEAALAMNAKNILLFGRNSLIHDRIYVLGAFNIVAALISFFFFGISLVSLRIPYVIFNVLGNIVFFDFLRRSAGKKIAVTAAGFFALFFSHIVIGKSAMIEAGILPILLVLCWVMLLANNRPRLYFFLGFLSLLAGINKPDNLIVFFILAAYAFFDDLNEKNDLHKTARFLRARWLFFGAGAMLLLWCGYIVFFGFRQFLFYYKFELCCNDVRALRFGFYGSPGSFELIKNNLLKIWEWDPLFAAGSLISVVAAAICFIFDRGALRNPVFRAGLLFLGLCVFKVVFGSYFVGQWRLAPCYPLPFFALAYIGMNLSNLSKALSGNHLKRYYFGAIILLGAGILFCIYPLLFKSIQLTGRLIFQPTYKIVNNVERLRKTLDPGSRIIFSEGHFTYCALLLPHKFYDVIPNLEAKEFDLLESDPSKIWETIQFDKQIAYLMVRPVNQPVMGFANSIPGAKLITTEALPFEPGYLYQIRWPPTTKESLPKFLGKWEE